MSSRAVETLRIDALLTDHVVPAVLKQFEERRTLFDEIMVGEGQEVNSRGCGIPAYVRESPSAGWRGEAGKLPSPVAPEDIRMRVRYTRYRRSIEITDDVMAHFKKKGADMALVKTLADQLTRQFDSGYKDLNRYLYGSGNAEVARVTGVGSSPTIDFSKTTANGNTHGSRKIIIGGRYQFFTSAGVQRTGGSVTVSICTARNRVTGQATFDAVPSDAAATDILVLEDSHNSALRGLLYHVVAGTGVYQTVSRGDYDVLKSVVVPGNSEPITVAKFSRLEHEFWFRVDEPDAGDVFYISNVGQHFAYELLGHALRRTDLSERTLSLGYKEVNYNGMRWLIDPDCDHDKIYRIRKDILKKFELRAYGIIEDTGYAWHKKPGFDSSGDGTHYGADLGYIGWDGELGSLLPAALGVINQLDISNIPVGDLA